MLASDLYYCVFMYVAISTGNLNVVVSTRNVTTCVSKYQKCVSNWCMHLQVMQILPVYVYTVNAFLTVHAYLIDHNITLPYLYLLVIQLCLMYICS